MLAQSLIALVRRELRTLRREVEAYPSDDHPWRAVDGLPNSGGMLVRHLCGNLRHFIGAQLGDTGYVRDREAEFHAPPASRAALVLELEATEREVLTTLAGLAPERLEESYPQALLGQQLVTGDFLLHLASHLAFHLGQVDYHRRVVTGDRTSVAPMSIPALASARPVAGPGH